MARHASLAEYYRAHRRAFERALETGVTPAEAAVEIEREEAIARCREAERRLQAKLHAPITPRVSRAGHEPEVRLTPYWLRD